MSSNGGEVELSKPRTPGQSFTLVPSTLEEAMRFAELLAKSDLVPRDYQGKPGNVLIACQMGAEVGLSPTQAIQSIAVINGRPSLWGDGQLAVVQNHKDYEWHDESMCTNTQGVCTIKRKGHEAYTVTFTLEDAREAQLLMKPGAWQTHRKRMLQLRARAFALRDKFSDALKGLHSAEEAIDIAEMMPLSQQPEPPKRQSLVDKLKAQVEAQVPPELVPSVEPLPDTVPEPTPTDHAAMGIEIMKQDFNDRLAAAANVREAVDVLNAVLDSDLPKEWKSAFKLRFDTHVSVWKKR